MKPPEFMSGAGQACPSGKAPAMCPLNQVQAGATVRICQLAASTETSQRLREIGFCEQQTLRLLARHGNFICQIQNCRMGIGAALAQSIMVEEITGEEMARNW